MISARNGVIRWLAILLLFGAIGFSAVQSASAQNSSRAAIIVITSAGVSLQRTSTSNPIPLSLDAVAIVGAGDRLLTNGRGRALVRFEDSIDLLIMPNTTLEIIDIILDGDTPQIHLRVIEGNIILGDPEREPTPIITVETDRLTLTPVGTVGIWGNFDNSDVLTAVEAGSRYVSQNGESGRVGAGDGLLADDTGIEVVFMRGRTTFLHAAQLIASQRGCAARVFRTGGQALNVRVAPGLGNVPIGFIEENAPVSIMGMIDGGSWYRVQRFTGFGWMRSSFLDGSCSNLRIYPTTSVERNLDLLNLQPTEYELIQPFFGTPDTNPWVYRTFRPSPYDTEQP